MNKYKIMTKTNKDMILKKLYFYNNTEIIT